jgi:hypothetical protein
MQILSPTLNLRSQTLWRWGPWVRVLTGSPGDSAAGSSLRTHWPRRPGRGLVSKRSPEPLMTYCVVAGSAG